MNYIKKNFLSIILITFVMLLPILSFAQDKPDCSLNPLPAGCNLNPPATNTNLKIVNPIPDVTDINGLIAILLKGAIKIGLPVLTLAIVYCGFLFVSARGNSEKLGEAKRALLYTLIGAAILLGSLAIAQLIKDTVLAL